MKSNSLNLFVLILLISCAGQQVSKDPLSAYDVSLNFVTTSKETNDNFKPGNHVVIVSFSDKVMYIFERHRKRSVEIKDNQRKVADTVDETVETSRDYFIRFKDQNRGLFYRFSPDLKIGIPFRVDSLLASHGLDKRNLKFNDQEMGNPYVIKKMGTGVVRQAFIVKKTSPRDADTIYRYFDSSLKNVPFSLSDSLDRKNNSKLFKTVEIYNDPLPMPSNMKYNPKLKSVFWELKKVSVNNKEEIYKAFKLFDNDVKKGKIK